VYGEFARGGGSEKGEGDFTGCGGSFKGRGEFAGECLHGREEFVVFGGI